MANSPIVKDVLREYERDRADAARLRDARREELYARAPRLREVDGQLASAGLSAARLVMGGGADAAERLKAQAAALSEERRAILSGLSVAEDWAEDVFKCPACRDTGYIGSERCACMKRRLIDRYAGLSKLDTVLARENFDTFDLSYYSEEENAKTGTSPRANIRRNLAACENFVKRFGEKFENLLLYGDTGLGKTFLCNCVAKEILERGLAVVYVTAPQLCKMMNDARFNRQEGGEPELFLALAADADLLMIDDLGTEVSSVVTDSELFELLNARLRAAKPTVISTNLSPDHLQERFSDRVCSRILGNYTLLRFFGSDIRLKKKYGR